MHGGKRNPGLASQFSSVVLFAQNRSIKIYVLPPRESQRAHCRSFDGHVWQKIPTIFKNNISQPGFQQKLIKSWYFGTLGVEEFAKKKSFSNCSWVFGDFGETSGEIGEGASLPGSQQSKTKTHPNKNLPN